METDLKKCSQLQFLANLDLFTPKEVDSVLDIVQTFSRKKINYRNMTYVPEMLDKKQRYYIKVRLKSHRVSSIARILLGANPERQPVDEVKSGRQLPRLHPLRPCCKNIY